MLVSVVPLWTPLQLQSEKTLTVMEETDGTIIWKKSTIWLVTVPPERSKSILWMLLNWQPVENELMGTSFLVGLAVPVPWEVITAVHVPLPGEVKIMVKVDGKSDA